MGEFGLNRSQQFSFAGGLLLRQAGHGGQRGRGGCGPRARALGLEARAPAVHGAQVRGHVVLAVELFVADFAGVWVALEVGGDVVPVEVAGVGVGVVAHLATVRVLWWTFVDAETSNADRVWRLGGAQSTRRRGVKICEFGFNLLLHLEVHQVGAGAGRAGLGVHAAPRKLLLWRFRIDGVHQVGDGEPLGVPEHLVAAGAAGHSLRQGELLLLHLDPLLHLRQLLALALEAAALAGVAAVSALAVRLLHGEVEDWRGDGGGLGLEAGQDGGHARADRVAGAGGRARALAVEGVAVSAVPHAVADVQPLLWN